ncbi:MAG: NUDIX hydrolase [Candidatus Woesearchaeota archaeon]
MLLHKRTKRPYINKWSLLGGRIRIEETIEQAAKRVVKKLAGVEITNPKLQTIAHEHTINEQKEITHSFILFYLEATTNQEVAQTARKKWYKKTDVPQEETIHSDYELLTKKHPKFTTFITQE